MGDGKQNLHSLIEYIRNNANHTCVFIVVSFFLSLLSFAALLQLNSLIQVCNGLISVALYKQSSPRCREAEIRPLQTSRINELCRGSAAKERKERPNNNDKDTGMTCVYISLNKKRLFPFTYGGTVSPSLLETYICKISTSHHMVYLKSSIKSPSLISPSPLS